MSKEKTEEQWQKQRQKEAKEIKKWERIKSKPLPAHYFAILIVVLTIIYVVDEITSNINSSMQPNILFDLFNITSQDVNDAAYSSALNQMTIVSVFSMVFLVLAPFYKALSDKYGRRLFLAINTCMFGVGMLIIMVCNNIYTYMFGVILLGFVTPNDMQVMYIMEVAPKEHRAKLCSITKGIALVSVSLIGVLRTIFLTDSMSSWRMVYLIPVIVAIVVGLMSIFFVRETPVFIDERMNYLKTDPKEREKLAEDKKKKEAEVQGGVINAIKFIFSHKQIRAVAICALIFSASAAYTNYYSTIMSGGMTTDQVSIALIIYPFANGAVTFISGFISDKLGRKNSCLILGTLAMVSMAAFILAVNLGGGPIWAGIFYGVSIGGLWSMSDTLFLTMPGESVPTQIRVSVVGTMSLLLTIGIMVGVVLIVVGQNFFPMGWLCLCVSVPFMLISLLIMVFKVHETKGIDLETVTGTEWD